MGKLVKVKSQSQLFNLCERFFSTSSYFIQIRYLMKIINVLFIVSALFFSTKSLALNCDNPETTLEMNMCGELDLKRAEIKLNNHYQLALKKLDEVSKVDSLGAQKSTLKHQLMETQRLWVKFRESDCKTVYTLWSDGTIRNVMYLSCMRARAEQRAKELKQYETYGDGL
jgi:uncharacterized protein YecT (DUF1311 family)